MSHVCNRTGAQMSFRNPSKNGCGETSYLTEFKMTTTELTCLKLWNNIINMQNQHVLHNKPVLFV